VFAILLFCDYGLIFFAEDRLAALGSRRFAACDCSTQTFLAGNAAKQLLLLALSHVVSYRVKRSMNEEKKALLPTKRIFVTLLKHRAFSL